jgi:hypothetical protein
MGSNFCILYVLSSFSSTAVKEGVFYPIYIFDAFVKNQMAVPAWAYFWVFCSISLVYVPIP